MSRLDFQVDRYAYIPSPKKLNRYKNHYKPKDVLSVSKEKFHSFSTNRDTYGYLPLQTANRRSASLPPNRSSYKSSIEDLNNGNSNASTMSFRSTKSEPPEKPSSTIKQDEVMIYNAKKSTFEPENTALEVVNSKNTRRPAARISTLTPPRGVEPTIPESKSSFSEIENYSGQRPKPAYTSSFSNLEKSKGIEFKTSESRDQLGATALLGFSREIPSPTKHLRDSKIERFGGIGEDRSEYVRRYTVNANGQKPKPSWFTWEPTRTISGVDL